MEPAPIESSDAPPVEPMLAAATTPAMGQYLELKSLNKQLGTTFVYVTHDQEEALTMSDRIAVMDNARVAQLGTPAEIYENPRTAFVARLLSTCAPMSRSVASRRSRA